MEQKKAKNTEHGGLFKFDPIVLVRDVAKNWIVILYVVLLVSMAAFIYGKASYRPTYQTHITYVTYARSSATSVYSHLSAATIVASVFEDLLNSSLLHNIIMEESGLPQFDGTIRAYVIPETNLLTVTISGSNPRDVFRMGQAIVEHHEKVTYQVVDNVSLELLRSPTVPMAPSNSSDAMELVKMAALLSAVATIALIGYLSFRRDKVRSGQEATDKLDCTYLGDIAHEDKYKSVMAFLHRRRTRLLVTDPTVSFRFVETFRKLASRIEYHMHGRKVIMLTSVLENEGKSTVSINLAMSMAMKHENVLLIDCDLRKPECCDMVERSEIQYGLCDLLDGKADVNQALLQDKKSGLYMLLETNPTQASNDYLNSENMRTLLEWARQNFDLVVLDLPPMEFVSDAESVMELVDSSLLVVRQNLADADKINKAVAALEKGKAKLLGCVLNNVHTSSLTSGSYGYGYGYGYGYRYGYGKYGHYSKYGHYGKHGENNNE